MNKKLKMAVQLVKEVALLDGRLMETRMLDLLLRANATPREVMQVTDDVLPTVTGGVYYCALRSANHMAKEQIKRNEDIATQRKAYRDKKFADMKTPRAAGDTDAALVESKLKRREPTIG